MTQHTSTKPGFEGFSVEIKDAFEHMGVDTVCFMLIKNGSEICSVYGEIELDNRNWKVESFTPIEFLSPDGLSPYILTVMTEAELIEFVCSIPDAFCMEYEPELDDAPDFLESRKERAIDINSYGY